MGERTKQTSAKNCKYTEPNRPSEPTAPIRPRTYPRVTPSTERGLGWTEDTNGHLGYPVPEQLLGLNSSRV